MIFPARSQILRYKKPPSGGGGLDPDLSAWIAAVISAGGTVSGTQQTNVGNLIASLKANSLFSTCDRIWLLASENIHQAQIDLVNRATWTQNGTVTFAAGAGMTGDGSTGYLDTGLSSANVAHYAQDSGSIIVTTLSATSTSVAEYATISAFDFTETSRIRSDGGGNRCGTINQGGSQAVGAAATSQGTWEATRTGPTTNTLYLNGSSFATDTTASNGIPTVNWYVFAEDDFGSRNFSPETLGFVSFGAGHNATQAGQFYSAINTYILTQ